MQNIVLIGMPAAGKSTVGVLVAKGTLSEFIDTDLVIQAKHKSPLADLIEERGEAAFLALEEEALCSVTSTHAVIATGGSAVYSRRGMAHLHSIGTVVYLKLCEEEIYNRIGNLSTRGVVLHGAAGLDGIYRERCPLYEATADVVVDCTGRTTAECAAAVVEAVEAYRAGKS